MREQSRLKSLAVVQYFMAGLVLAVTGFASFERNPVLASVIMLSGILLMFFFIYARITRKKLINMKLLVLIAEGIAFLCTAYILGSRGKVYLPWAMVLAAVGCFIAVIVLSRKDLTPVKQD